MKMVGVSGSRQGVTLERKVVYSPAAPSAAGAGHYYYYIGWSVVTIISGGTVLTIKRGKRSLLQLPILGRMDTWRVFSSKKIDIRANLFLFRLPAQ